MLESVPDKVSVLAWVLVLGNRVYYDVDATFNASIADEK